MTLEQICVTKEWAEKLKEAGYPQESLHWWGGIGNMGIWCDHVKDDLPAEEKRFTWIAAPTASEILEKLPTMVEHRECNLFLGIWKRISGECAVRYKPNFDRMFLPVQFGSLPNALAKMYCYLVQENLIKKD